MKRFVCNLTCFVCSAIVCGAIVFLSASWTSY